MKLYLEWIPHLNCYRLFDSEFPYFTVAYVDSLQDAENQHPEYYYVVIDEVDN